MARQNIVRKVRSFNCLPLIVLALVIPSFSCQKFFETETGHRGTGVVSEAVAAPVLREYTISPATADPNIKSFLAAHFISVYEGATLKNALFVFIPGTWRAPSECRAIARKAASLGYHVISLSYPNNVAGNPLCADTDDITCHRRARQETIDGVDRHPSVNVDVNNSILNRLTKMLLHMSKTYPAQNWGQYLSSGQVNWSKVIVAGHSQGGSLAGVIGKMYPVKKVIMISMMDFLNSGKIPDWLTQAQNKEKYYAITSTKDELVPYNKVAAGWSAMGMTSYGPAVNVELTAPPYQSTHTLITTADPVTTLVDKYHNGTAIDTYIPKDAGGKYIYDAAWTYMLDATGSTPPPPPPPPPPSNLPPVANAGSDQSISLSWNYSPLINGTLSKDPDGWIVSFAWSKVSGPSSYSFASPNAGKTKVNNLVAGTYVFRVTATDNKGAKGTDDVTVRMY